MSHHNIKEGYKQLEEKLNWSPQGAPPSETLYKILQMLFTQKEAELVAQLPIRPFTIKAAAKIWKVNEVQAEIVLEELASRAILLDSDHNGVKKYMLPPPMAGFLEFTLMRTRGDIDQKLLSELLHQYLNVEEDFVKDLFWGSETKLGRTFVQEGILTNDNAIHILDYERASHVIESSEYIGLSMCYCRHKARHLGTACDAPLDTCMTFNNPASNLIRHGYARQIEASEALEVLQMAYEYNLVQCGENVRQGVTFLCNCCGCCCEAFVSAKRFGLLQPVHTTNFMPKVNDACVGCGKCAKVCPMEAISIVEVVENNQKVKKAFINEEVCLGCGVCVRNCPKKSIGLERRAENILTPVNTVHRFVLLAIEKGMLQNLIFDNQAFGSHRAMAAILSAILKLPPLKQALASKQLKSIYLDKLLSKLNV